MYFTLFKLWLIPLFLSQPPINSGQESKTYYIGDTLEIVIPRVFNEQDIGKAYPKFITGLKGDRMVESNTISSTEKTVETIFYQFQDGLILNAWGTGLGMYDKGLAVDTNIRRAQLTLMKVTSSKALLPSNYEVNKNPGRPMLLVTIDYGYSFNLSISGQKERFTQEVFNSIKERIDNNQTINGLLKENELKATFAFRGISPKTSRAEIPNSWEDLKSKYILNRTMPVFGKYVLLDQIKAQKIEWVN